MKTCLKPTTLALAMMMIGLTHSANAQPTLFHFTLTVNEVSDPQIFVGRDKRQFQPTDQGTFNVKGRQSDYFFTVNYQHDGSRKEAVCEISGVPQQIVATIDPTKVGRDACKTEEVGRG